MTDVIKTYRRDGTSVHALRGVDLHIETQGFYAIMGASGSGKSTLLHLLAGLDRPDSGDIRVGDCALCDMTERELTQYRRRSIGIVFQQFNLIPTLTARANVELPGMLAGESHDWLRHRSDELLDALSITDRGDHRPDALSGGEQQRIAIARALLFKPRVVFADEPTGSLDSHTGEQFWNVLHDVAREHATTVLAVTHEPSAAVHCEEAFVLADGQIVGQFSTEGLDVASLSIRYQQLGHAT
ncbi:MAG: ABC transporter ATP-binding protein [Phycisphaerales bacterium]|nr:ABC transporter ATP-binding protein [Phycisphaerales bacterium]